MPHVLATPPLGMGLLLPPPASLPAWHPATKALYAAMRALGSETEQVVAIAVAWSVHLVAAAGPDAGRTRIVVGMSIFGSCTKLLLHGSGLIFKSKGDDSWQIQFLVNSLESLEFLHC